MRIKANLIALAAIATFGGGVVLAQGTPSTGPSSSSPSSAPPSTPAASGSGYLTSPSTGSSTTSAGDKFGTLDKDHDGMISKAESRKDKELAKQFDTLDTNKDGKLDQAEFAPFEAAAPSAQKPSSGKQD